MDAPKSQACRKDFDYAAHALGLCVQLTMSQESADILGYPLFFDIQVDQAITLMTQVPTKEIDVEREKCWPLQFMEQSDYCVIFHALPPNTPANLLKSHMFVPQQGALALRDIFIQDIHAGWDS
jgi:hypothetical protein